MTPAPSLVSASRRTVEMVRWWDGAPAQLLPAWSALSVALIEGGELAGPARDLVRACVDRDGWPPEHQRVMDELAVAVEAVDERAATTIEES